MIQKRIIKPQLIGSMSHYDMNPDKWSKMIQEKKQRDKGRFENTMEASTDMFTCHKCKSKKCTYKLVQIRSADEPMTCFITCLTCGYNWKKN
jgi:transcription elongation factor S-II